MTTGAVSGLPPLRYLAAADVEAAMPPVGERIELAARALASLAGEAELPPKIGVHPRPVESFAHAMPAHLRDAAGTRDLLGMKWIAGFPTNNALGIRTLHSLVVLNDSTSGVPVAILDGGPLTAHRTASVSGLAIRAFAPHVDGRAPRVGMIGAGVQGHSHLPVIAHLLPNAELSIYNSRPERAAALAGTAAMIGIAPVRVAASPQLAVADADIVITVASFGPVRQVMPPDWLAPNALVVPVDYATYVSAAVARNAALFLVDERGQFEANRAAGLFDDYPDPRGTIGEALAGGWARPEGRVVVTHLGVGIADLVFADAILTNATRDDLGTVLRR